MRRPMWCSRSFSGAAAGRFFSTCRLSAVAGCFMLAGVVSVSAQTPAPEDEPGVTVVENAGVYTVGAAFTVPEPAGDVLAVLTDYSSIPRFMPQVRTSIVRDREDGRATVEQEAVARFMMFRKRIHLVLSVEETPTTLRFRDVCGSSFGRYEGTWRVDQQDGTTRVRYELTAKPAFSVPEFLLQRLLKRDAAQMVEGLRAEIARRGRGGD